MATLTTQDIIDYLAIDPLPSGNAPGEDWVILIGDPADVHVWLSTVAQLRAVLAPNTLFLTSAPTGAGREGQLAYVTTGQLADLWQFEAGAWVVKLKGIVLNPSAGAALPKPLPATFTNFQDTQAGGSVVLVPAAGLTPGDYRYRFTATGNFQAVPPDGTIVVDNAAGAVYAYSVATAARQQSDLAVSNNFTAYTPPGQGNTTPAAPTFDNFDDTANTVRLVPAAGVPMTDYQYKLGATGTYATPPADGILSVGASFAGQVFAYSIAITGRNQSLTGASPGFTAAPTTTPGPTVPDAPVGLEAGGSSSGTPTITITGGVPASDGGAAISTYNVYRDGGATAIDSFPAPSGGAGLTYDDTKMTAGAPHSYQFTAINSKGEGPKSTPSNLATAAPLGPPTFTQALNPGDNVGTFTWGALTGTRLRYNNPIAPSSGPGALALLVFYPDMNTQVGQLNFDVADTGKPYAVTTGGVDYYKDAATGNYLTLKDGSVLLGN